MTNTPAKRPHFPALDGLRGVACLLVVFYHNFPALHGYLFFGWLAMDIFFVLSGFLITDILINTIGSENFLKNFYARRLLRVFPLYFTSMILFLLVLPFVINFPFPIDYFLSNQIYYWTFLQNWLLILHPHPSQSYLNHLWSMAVEEQFYLLWPFIFIAIRKPKPLLALLAVLLIVFNVVRFWLWINHIEGFNYFSFFSFTRIDGICIGCMVALLQKLNTNFIGKNTAIIVLAFAAINFIFYLVNLRYGNTFPYILVGYSTFSMVFGLLVYDLINQRTKFFELILSVSFLRFFGMISYGTYIFHWPLYLLISPWLTNWAVVHLPQFPPSLFASIIATLLAFCIGYTSYRFFELRFLRLKKYFA
jgi:peptidoglycan/LPS O-acetylase OafA/YrhL